MGKKVLISGYIGFSNFGDDAMLKTLVDFLKQKECDITALSSNPKSTKEMFNIKSS
ncbi:TPA: polysaccharide pyruvyl transferase CsaB, partial [Candidatus Galligastranaerophilus gallistercoris]|nr:polysaccharide pyruvyl transferase CsaB [Candidatus Galligastranaerophilus gallistercoris]